MIEFTDAARDDAPIYINPVHVVIFYQTAQGTIIQTTMGAYQVQEGIDTVCERLQVANGLVWPEREIDS